MLLFQKKKILGPLYQKKKKKQNLRFFFFFFFFFLNNLCAGVYYVQIKDSLGCSLIDSVTITEPDQILANQQITAATCGVCNGGIIISPSGGIGTYSVLW